MQWDVASMGNYGVAWFIPAALSIPRQIMSVKLFLQISVIIPGSHIFQNIPQRPPRSAQVWSMCRLWKLIFKILY